jgi:hypothetical protein
MAAAPHTRPGRRVPSKKSKRQKQCRRKSTLMTKACEYSKMCDADVCGGIRLRETGQVYILSADASGFWAFLSSQLVRRQCYLVESPLTPPEFILSNPEASNGSRSRGSLTCMHYSGILYMDKEIR